MKTSLYSITCIYLFFASSCKNEMQDFVGDYSTAYSESIETVEYKSGKRIYFAELMPVGVKIFNDAQTNAIKGEMRFNYHAHVHISVPLKGERVWEMKDFRISGDTLECTAGSKMIIQIIKSPDGNVFGMEKKYIGSFDLYFFMDNPLFISESKKMIYYRVPDSFNERLLTKEFYTVQINEWKDKLKERPERQLYIDYLTERIKK